MGGAEECGKILSSYEKKGPIPVHGVNPEPYAFQTQSITLSAPAVCPSQNSGQRKGRRIRQTATPSSYKLAQCMEKSFHPTFFTLRAVVVVDSSPFPTRGESGFKLTHPTVN